MMQMDWSPARYARCTTGVMVDQPRGTLPGAMIVAFLLALVAASAGAQGVRQSGDALVAQVEAELQRDISDARAMNGEAPAIRIQRVDLNGDGRLDAIARVEHPFTCGSGGCAVHVFVSDAGRLRRVGSFLAHEASVAATITSGWRDLAVHGRRWVFAGDRYREAN
jgi:hypothetical protein